MFKILKLIKIVNREQTINEQNIKIQNLIATEKELLAQIECLGKYYQNLLQQKEDEICCLKEKINSTLAWYTALFVLIVTLAMKHQCGAHRCHPSQCRYPQIRL